MEAFGPGVLDALSGWPGQLKIVQGKPMLQCVRRENIEMDEFEMQLLLIG